MSIRATLKLNRGLPAENPLPLQPTMARRKRACGERGARRRNCRSAGRRSRPTSPPRRKARRRPIRGSRRRCSRRRAPKPRATPNSIAANTRPCARWTASMPGSSAPAIPALSPSTPRRRAPIRCRRSCADFRLRSRRTRPVTCRYRTGKAATARAAACSAAIGRPTRLPKARRSMRSNHCSQIPAC